LARRASGQKNLCREKLAPKGGLKMKVEIAPERDGRVVITILPEEEGKTEVKLEEPKSEKVEDVVVKDQEAKLQALEEDSHFYEEVEEAQEFKRQRKATEKQVRYFHYLARKAGIQDTHAWMEQNGFPPSSRDCSQAQLSCAIDMLKELEWARSLEAPGWRKKARLEPVEAA